VTTAYLAPSVCSVVDLDVANVSDASDVITYAWTIADVGGGECHYISIVNAFSGTDDT